MTPEQQQLVADLKATIEKAQQQLTDLEKPQFAYPMWCKNKTDGTVVKFTDITTGTVVQGVPSVTEWGWIPHTDTSIWEQIPEPKKQWEPKCGMYFVGGNGDVEKFRTALPNNYRDADDSGFGNVYQTEAQAEWARDQMRQFNRLLAYVAEFDVDENGVQWKPDWNDAGQRKYFVFLNVTINKWVLAYNTILRHIDVYMSEQCAKGLVEKLNSGEVVL